jgi:hypothetical protein
VVVIFYGMANFNYDKPREGYSLDMDILVSVLFCVVTPHAEPHHLQPEKQEGQGCPEEAGWKTLIV